MADLACQRCGHEWDYTGGSEHYCTCPNCKTSVSVRGSERAEPSETAERGTTSDRAVTVEFGGEEVPVAEAVARLEESVAEVRATGEARGESLGELGRDVEEQGETVAELERGLEEVAGYFKQLIEEAGGEVDYDHVDAGKAVPEALKDMDMDEVYDPTEEFEDD